MKQKHMRYDDLREKRLMPRVIITSSFNQNNFIFYRQTLSRMRIAWILFTPITLRRFAEITKPLLNTSCFPIDSNNKFSSKHAFGNYRCEK